MLKVIKKILVASFVFSFWLSALALISYLNMNPADLNSFFGASIGRAVGTTINKASVPENPINKLALDLSVKEKELNRYEELLNEKEAEITKNSSLMSNQILLTLVASIGALFFLVSINFYFDHKRRAKDKKAEEKKSGAGTV